MLVLTGDNDTFTTLTYGLPSQSLVDYAREQYQRIAALPISHQFLERSRAILHENFSDEAMMRERALLEQAQQVLTDPNLIVPQMTLYQLQTATPVMQRWIMAMPDLRQHYLDQTIHAYVDTYWDPLPTWSPYEHPDYRQVTSGIVTLPDENGLIHGQAVPEDVDWIARFSYDAILDIEASLSSEDKFAILSTWEAVRGILKHSRDDPTSPYGGER